MKFKLVESFNNLHMDAIIILSKKYSRNDLVKYQKQMEDVIIHDTYGDKGQWLSSLAENYLDPSINEDDALALAALQGDKYDIYYNRDMGYYGAPDYAILAKNFGLDSWLRNCDDYYTSSEEEQEGWLETFKSITADEILTNYVGEHDEDVDVEADVIEEGIMDNWDTELEDSTADQVENYLKHHPYTINDDTNIEDICAEICDNLFDKDYYNCFPEISHAVFSAVSNYADEFADVTPDEIDTIEESLENNISSLAKSLSTDLAVSIENNFDNFVEEARPIWNDEDDTDYVCCEIEIIPDNSISEVIKYVSNAIGIPENELNEYESFGYIHIPVEQIEKAAENFYKNDYVDIDNIQAIEEGVDVLKDQQKYNKKTQKRKHQSLAYYRNPGSPEARDRFNNSVNYGNDTSSSSSEASASGDAGGGDAGSGSAGV